VFSYKWGFSPRLTLTGRVPNRLPHNFERNHNWGQSVLHVLPVMNDNFIAKKSLRYAGITYTLLFNHPTKIGCLLPRTIRFQIHFQNHILTCWTICSSVFHRFISLPADSLADMSFGLSFIAMAYIGSRYRSLNQRESQTNFCCSNIEYISIPVSESPC
jgi:hypothetical protein